MIDLPHTIGFSATDEFPRRLFIYRTSSSSNDRFKQCSMARFAGPSHNGTAVTCARIHKTPTSHADVSTTPLRDIGPPQLRPRVEDTIGPPARRSIIAARLGESMQSRRWRSGLVRPPDPARGCVD